MLRLSARPAQQCLEVLLVIRQKNHKPQQNPQRVSGKEAGLQIANERASDLRQSGAEIQQAVDDPFVPPHRQRRAKAREPAGAVYANAVDDFRVETAEERSEVLGAVDEERIVDFVDVILVKEELVETRHFSGYKFGGNSPRAIKCEGQPDARHGYSDRAETKDVLKGRKITGSACRFCFGPNR